MSLDFDEKLQQLGARIKELRPHIATEEATKTSLIMPFLQLLGYDTFDPRVVVPEYTADLGTKKGEKVDYAVLQNGEPILLFEVKCCGAELDGGKANQLRRYFQSTPTARIGVLTDGVRYEFFSDLDQTNLMDDKPFMVFNFEQIDESLISQLRRLSAERFDQDATLSAAQNLKYTGQIKQKVREEFNDPSDDLVKLFAGQVYTGRFMPNVLEEFRGRVRQALSAYISDLIRERLDNLMGEDEPGDESLTGEQDYADEKVQSKIITTDEELEAFQIVRAILREVVEVSRIAMRDRQSYCGVLLDDNNRKPLCRFHFNTIQKYIGVINEDKTENKHPIETLDDIFKYAEQIKKAVSYYE